MLRASRRRGVGRGSVVFLAALAAVMVGAVAAQPPPASTFSLLLPELADRPFASGGLVEVPDGTRISALQFALAARHARRVDEGAITAQMDGRPLVVTVVVADDRKSARYRVADATHPIVVRKGADVRLRAAVRGRDDLAQEWLLRAGATPFIVERAGDRDGERLNVVLKAPADRPILFQGTAQLPVDVRGEVFPARDLRRLTIAGASIPPDRTQDRLAFSAAAVADATTRELVIEADDEFGRMAAVIVPIVKAGGAPAR